MPAQPDYPPCVATALQTIKTPQEFFAVIDLRTRTPACPQERSGPKQFGCSWRETHRWRQGSSAWHDGSATPGLLLRGARRARTMRWSNLHGVRAGQEGL